MRISAITLRNFRGITEQTVEFGAGVTIVEGPNEVGKSSIAEALRLARTFKASSRAKEILVVAPVGRDVAPTVEITMRTGDFDLTFRKTWLKKPSTELEIRLPKPQQISGDEAHDRFLAILAETVDLDLLDALTVVQGESLQRPDLAAVQALHRALDDSGATVDGHDALMSRIEAEYARHFTTKNGQPTGEYRRMAGEADRCLADRDALRARSAEMDVFADEHASSERRRSVVSRQLADARTGLEHLVAEAERAETLRTAVAVAERGVADATLAVSAALAEQAVRIRDAEQVVAGAERIEQLTALHTDHGDELRRAESRLADSKRRAVEAESLSRGAERAATVARDSLESARSQIEYDELLGRVERARAIEQQQAAARGALAQAPVDDAAVEKLARLEMAATVARGIQVGAAALLRVTHRGAGPVSVDGVTLESAAVQEVPVLARVLVETTDAMIEVLPGQSPAELDADAERTGTELAQALAAHGVTTIDEAKAAAVRRRTAAAALDAAEAALAAALGSDSLSELQARLVELAARIGAAGDPPRPDEAPGSDEPDAPGPEESAPGADNRPQSERPLHTADLALASARAAAADASAREARDAAHRDLERDRQEQDAARVASHATEAELAAEIRDGSRMRTALELARAAVSDAELANRVSVAEAAVAQAESINAAAAAALASTDPETLDMLLSNAKSLVESKRVEVDELQSGSTKLRALIDDRAREGIYDKLAAAEAAYEAAESAYLRLDRSARAVQLLRDTMWRHRAQAQRRYVAPFKVAIERLGRVVFGATFQVEISDDLAIESRTLAGATVPFGSLSAGAREQLALIGRLACAQLVDADAGAPVILDDTLGFADPGRLAQLGVVIGEVGRHAQVIVLTCQPDRFAAVGGAGVVRLSGA